MDWLDALSGLADGLAWVVTLAGLSVVVGRTARRVLGVRVGWPRTVVVCAIAIIALLHTAAPMLVSGRIPEQGAGGAGGAAYLFVMMLWTFALSATVLVVLEIMVPTGSLPGVRALFSGWGRRWRRGRRYAQILAIAARHGLAAPLRGFRPAEADHVRLARGLRDALQDAGVTFVKLGQMLSTRADLLPAAYVRELTTLTNRVPAQPWQTVRTVVESELGRPVDEVLAAVDPDPLASASLAQVHSGRLLNGREVVVKVQRPGAQAQVDLDLEILTRLVRSLERNTGWARRIGLSGLAQGFAASLREELDYRVEVDNMTALRAALATHDVRLPEVETDLCTRRLIVMERMSGTPVAQATDLIATLAPDVREAAANRLLGSVLTQVVDAGVFHADLHAGNVLIWPDGTVGLLDFGAVGRLDAVSRRSLAMLLWAVDADDPVTATDALLDLLDRPEHLDERELQRALGTLLTRVRGGLGSGGSLAMFSELFSLVVAHGFRVPPMIAAALRSLGALEGTLRSIDPKLDLVAAAREVGRDTIGEVTPERVKAELTDRALRLVPMLERLPRRIDKITQDLEQGRLTAHVRIVGHPDDRAFLLGLVQQLVVAVLAAAGVVGGILLAVAPGGPQLAPGLGAYALVGALVAFAGFVLGLRAVALVYAGRAG